MTPRERAAAAAAGQKPDKLPIMVANSNTFICQYYGLTVREFLTDPDKCTRGNIAFTEEFDIDYNLCINGYILYGCGPELGCQWRYAGRDFPGFTSGPLRTEADLANIRVPEKPEGYFAHYLEATDRVCAALGAERRISVSMLGPFAVACFLRGIETALLDTIRNIDFFKQYMEVCTELSIWFARRILEIDGVQPILNEIFLTPEMVRPDSYHRLIAPYDLRVQEAVGPENAPNSLAAFMGRPGDPDSQKNGAKLYKAFFKGADSVDELKALVDGRMPGMPIPASISGPALDDRTEDELIAYLEPVLDFLVKDQGIYPSILLASVQADSPEKAGLIAARMKALARFRDQYIL